MTKPGFECKFCGRPFKNETFFMRHRCEEMKRNDELRSITGQRAYEFYSHWMRAYKRSVPPIETFASSRYFRSFMNFAEYVQKLKLYKPQKFIELMHEKDISPQLWTRNEPFQYYSNWLDMVSDPLEQAAASADVVFNLAEIFKCKTGEVFERLTAPELTDLIRQRKLSMFLLLCSQRFKERMAKLDELEMSELFDSVNRVYYAERFERDPAIVQQLKAIASEVGI